MSVYSHRFLAGEGAGQVLTYTVPAGQVAVVRSASAVALNQAAGEARLLVAGRAVWTVSLTGALPAGNVEMRHVAYGGETIQTYLSAAYLYVTVSGYLFRDEAAADAAPGVVEEDWAPIAAAMPA